MDKKLKALIIAIVIIFLGSCGIFAYNYFKTPSDIVNIVSCGEVIYTIDLSTAPDEQYLIADDVTQEYNLITIKDGKIFVEAANCPDQVCVLSGTLDHEGIPIICLPHELVIEYVEK